MTKAEWRNGKEYSRVLTKGGHNYFEHHFNYESKRVYPLSKTEASRIIEEISRGNTGRNIFEAFRNM